MRHAAATQSPFNARMRAASCIHPAHLHTLLRPFHGRQSLFKVTHRWIGIPTINVAWLVTTKYCCGLLSTTKHITRRHEHGFTMFMAGGGVKSGIQFGSTDDYGYYVQENPVHFHDLHATILHLMGIDHEQLTYRYAGRDFRLTDVHGHVVDGIIA